MTLDLIVWVLVVLRVMGHKQWVMGHSSDGSLGYESLIPDVPLTVLRHTENVKQIKDRRNTSDHGHSLIHR